MRLLAVAKRFHAIYLVGLTALLWSVAVPAHAEGIGKITHLNGVLRAESIDGASRLLSIKSEIRQGDTLKTESGTFARIKFNDNGEVVLRPDTEFKVESYVYSAGNEAEDNIVLALVKGGLRSVTGLLGKRTPNKFRLNTPVATIGIRGTHFGALLCNNDCSNIPNASGGTPENGLHTDTAQGIIVISNDAGSLEFPAGSFSFTADINTPPTPSPPQQGVPVTMPPAISNNNSTGQELGNSPSGECGI